MALARALDTGAISIFYGVTKLNLNKMVCALRWLFYINRFTIIMNKLYFTRDGDLVHIQSNPKLRGSHKVPVDIYIRPQDHYAGLSYAVLWNAGAGEIIIQADGSGKIVCISQDQDDKIYSWSDVADTAFWYHMFENDPCVMMPFHDDYETSLNDTSINFITSRTIN